MKRIKSIILISIIMLSILSCASLPNQGYGAMDIKHASSVEAYIKITYNYLGKWDNLEKAQENLNYAYDAYHDISPVGKFTQKSLFLAEELSSLKKKIKDRSKKEQES